jgi:hypothetical protein
MSYWIFNNLDAVFGVVSFFLIIFVQMMKAKTSNGERN